MKFSPKCNTKSDIGKFVISFGNFCLYLGKNRGQNPCMILSYNRCLAMPGLSHPFLGMGPGPLELGKNSVVLIKIGKKYKVLCIEVVIVRLI